jgi:pimeloyl-ACP methyl ester carboxylesterase
MQQQSGDILPFDEQRLIFLHGLESSGQGYKARLLRDLFPAMLTPDFTGSIDERMAQLAPILGTVPGWTIIGSSFGGLMGALWACAHPQQVRRLVLLAPALSRPAFAENLPAPVDVPGVVYHGQHDTVVPLEPVRALVEQTFPHLAFWVVDDDHMLRATVQTIDWQALLA